MSKTTKAKTEPKGGARLVIDYGPLLVFFLTYFLAPVPSIARIFIATGVFMAVMVVAMIFSAIRYRSISPILWFSGISVVLFGGLTLYFHNEAFIKLKPTLYYSVLAGVLTFGLVTGRPLLQAVLGSTYPGLDEAGWRKLTRNWALFFVGMAILNEAVWRNSTTSFWVGFKLWGALPLTLVFALSNIPMLMRHGLMREDAAPAEPGPVE